MISASSLAFPGSRTLAGWWRQLAPHQPRAFGVGHLFVHQVEMPVTLRRSRKIDPFLMLILKALDLETVQENPGMDIPGRLETRLGLDRPFLFRVLESLRSQGLAGADWRLTPAGRQALDRGEYSAQVSERRVLHFLECVDNNGQRRADPHFLNLNEAHVLPWQPGAGFSFPPDQLQQCLQQGEIWKEKFGFPADIFGFPPIHEAARDEWQWVVLDRPQRLLVVWVFVPGVPGQKMLGFSARQEGWFLNSGRPIFQIEGFGEEFFPELAHNLAPESLQGTWLSWARGRGLPESEAARCSASLVGQRLEIHVPTPFLDSLRALRSDVFKGETWLLAGQGHIRTAVLLEIKPEVKTNP